MGYLGNGGFGEIEKKIEKMYKETIQDVKHKIETIAPKPVKDMLNTEEGTYFLLSVLVILIIGILRVIGGMLSFIFKVILLIATLSAVFFAMVYFFGHG
jgi:uncharacterized membrane protein